MSTADLLLRNAVVRTMDDRGTVADALAIQGDRILAAGTADDLIARFRGDRTTVLDLGGHTVLPGFIDAHVHFEMTSLAVARWVDCRPPGVRSIADIVERLGARAAETPPGKW